ncbi:MAG: cytochrome c biogenesis protein ResB [Ornithinimicrobium sp.]
MASPTLGARGWLRWTWRQLTSMRTALMLLLLLAVAAVPGSIWPQRSVDPAQVAAYLQQNPRLGPWLDRLGMFDVFSSPWFSGIYLLLAVSLIGCLVPRTGQHLSALRGRPPSTPRRLHRLPAFHSVTVPGPVEPAQVRSSAREVLRRRRYRTAVDDSASGLEVSAEAGYLKETGNVVFHLALLGVIVSVAVGHLWGWRGEVILPVGENFTSAAAEYDTLQPGPWVEENDLAPFQLRLDEMTVSFETEAEGAQFGAPREFSADVTTRTGIDSDPETERLAVNAPLSLDGASVYLLGNGYAPVVTVRDAEGQVVFSDAVPFLPQDDNYTSTGAVKVAGAEPELGLYGAFLPTARIDERGPTSDFPDLVDPKLAIGVYEGDLFPGGAPQSVYVLDTAAMEPLRDDTGEVSRLLLAPGQTATLPGGRGTVSLDGVVRWGGLVVRHDPGRLPVLLCAISALVGLVLMLGVRRRRVFVRVTEGGRGATDSDDEARHTGVTVQVAALVKDHDPGLQSFVERLAGQIASADHGGTVVRETAGQREGSR